MRTRYTAILHLINIGILLFLLWLHLGTNEILFLLLTIPFLIVGLHFSLRGAIKSSRKVMK